MAHYTRVFAVELCYLQLCMYLCMHPPLIVTLVITLPLDQVLQVVVTHSAVQYSLDLILFFTIDESWGWGGHRPSARDGIRMCKGQLDHGKDWVEAAEVGGKSEVICTMCKGTSIRFLTSPILAHSPPVHMYSLHSPLYHFQGPYL
jgi:hypothetical protein